MGERGEVVVRERERLRLAARTVRRAAFLWYARDDDHRRLEKDSAQGGRSCLTCRQQQLSWGLGCSHAGGRGMQVVCE